MLSKDIFSNKSQKGFTLIELMIVVAIIGILAAIAIPQFSEYRKKSYNAAAKSDLSNLALTMEHYYIDYSTYSSTIPTDFVSSSGVVISITNTTISGFTASSYHSQSDSTFIWNSEGGGLWKN